MKTATRLLGAFLAAVAMTIFVTWPQALHMGTHFASHQDPEFSIWRLGWIAHALATDPRHLFAANIFYPSKNPLVYSDAVLLEGVLGAPLFWLKCSPILIYNLMLLGGIALSGLAAYVLAYELTGASVPALFAVAVFVMAPYRTEHFMHLEMQWSMWIPLTFWALHRTVNGIGRPLTNGLLMGLFFWLQIVSCVYYGVFLALALPVLVVAAAVTNWRRTVAALPALAAGGALAALLAAPYMTVYMSAARDLGARDMTEIAVYSGHLSSYLAAPPQNWLRGWSAMRPEINLFLGWNAMALAVVGLVLFRVRRERAAYGALAVAAIVLSLGINTPIYGWIIRVIPTLQGLRCPARFSIIACCAISILVAFGVDAIREKLAGSRARWTWAVLPILFVFLLMEYANTGMFLDDLSVEVPGSVYTFMKSQGPGVLVELPIAHTNALPGFESTYERWSLQHWHPLVNGYSGYFPANFVETMARMETFPDDDSVARLGRLDTRYVIVHCAFMNLPKSPDACGTLLVKLGARPEFHAEGRFRDPSGNDAYLFVLER